MLAQLRTNLASKIRHDVLEGREYIVVPMVMITEGVHDGSDGPLFYPEIELSKSPVVWNHKPIVIYHPQVNGRGVSACDPTIMETQKVGIILNTTWSEGKLKSEAWLEKSRLETVDKRVLEALERGEKVEVSTGLFTDNEKAEGEFKGKKYSAIARNYRPDHLAILPDKKGACSIDDGAGLLANATRKYTRKECAKMARQGVALKDGSYPILNEADLLDALKVVRIGLVQSPAAFRAHVVNRAAALGKENLLPAEWQAPVANEASYSQIYSGLCDLLASKLGDKGKSWPGYIEDVFPSQVVYYDRGELYSHDYEAGKDGTVSLKGNPRAVRRVMKYEDRESTTNNEEGKTMTRAERVTAVITANVGWTDAHKQHLTDMSEELFAVVEKTAKPVQNSNPNPTPTPTPTPAPAAPAATPTPTPAPQPAALSLEQYIATAPPQLREVLQNGVNAHNAEKARLVAVIMNNANNRFTKEHLEARTLEELTGIAALAAPAAAVTNSSVLQGGLSPTYNGASAPSPTTPTNQPEPLALPTMNWSN